MTQTSKELDLSAVTQQVQMPICDRVIVSELSGDHVLPDYLPEIKRLLRVSPRIRPSLKYVSPASLEFAGSVAYDLLYTDGEGTLQATTVACDYELECPIEPACASIEGNSVFCDSEIESLSCRPVGPRKLVIKSKLRSRVRAFSNMDIKEEVEGVENAEDAFSVERLTKSYPVMQLMRVTGEELTLSEEVTLDAGDVRPVYSEGVVYVNDASCADGKVFLRGEAILRIVLEREGGEMYTAIRRLPFSDTLELDGAERGCDCRAWGSVSTISMSVERREGEERSVLFVEAGAVLEAQVQKEHMLQLVEDAYSCTYESECSMHGYELSRALRTHMGTVSVGYSVPISDAGVSPGENVIDAGGVATVSSVDIARGRYIVNGTCTVSLLLAGEETESAEFDIPFKYELDGEAVDECSFDCKADVTSMRVRIEGENVSVDAELALSVSLYAKQKVSGVECIRLLRDAPHKEESTGCSVVVCYPARGESLWNVAKRYHSSPKRIARSAGLDDTPDLSVSAHVLGIDHIIIEK